MGRNTGKEIRSSGNARQMRTLGSIQVGSFFTRMRINLEFRIISHMQESFAVPVYLNNYNRQAKPYHITFT